MDSASALARVRFPFGNASSPVRRDGVAYAEALARTVPLGDFTPRGSDAAFLSRHALILTGSVLVGTGADTGNRAVIGGELSQSSLFLPLLGAIRFQVGSRVLEARQGRSLAFLAGEAFRSENGFYAGACFSMPLERLAAEAAALAGDPGGTHRFLPGCLESRQIDLDGPLSRHLHQQLERSLSLLNALRLEPLQGGAEGDGIERLLIRLVALMLHPHLVGDHSGPHLPRLTPPWSRRTGDPHPPGVRRGFRDHPPAAG